MIWIVFNISNIPTSDVQTVDIHQLSIQRQLYQTARMVDESAIFNLQSSNLKTESLAPII